MRFLPILAALIPLALPTFADPAFAPGERSLFEAHNCYPYNSWYADRIDRALLMPPPIAIEMDMRWHEGQLIVAHDAPRTPKTPTLKEYAFDKLHLIVERALESEDHSQWPLFTLNVNDMRGDDPAMYAALWQLAVDHKRWLCTAVKGEDPDVVAPMTVGPVLLLTNGSRQALKTFYDDVPVGGDLLLFGSGDPDRPATNFRRWINYAWDAVEPEGQPKAGAWTSEDADRLSALVKHAHEQRYWIRFYTLNGHAPLAVVQNGWSPAYNFGTLEAAQIRWKAAREARVDFIASDQYEAVAQFAQDDLKPTSNTPEH